VTPELQQQIKPWRDKIDALDEQIVALLNERASCTLQVGAMKREAGVSVYDPARESDILQRVAAQGNGPLTAAALRRLFERILDESRSQERAGNERSDNIQKRRQ